MRVFTEPAGDLSAGDVWWQIKADSNDVRLVAETRNREHAARLAACWNACEGIPTEALEPGVVRELVEALEALVDELEWEIGEEKWGRDPDALPMARAVLAKVWVSLE